MPRVAPILAIALPLVLSAPAAAQETSDEDPAVRKARELQERGDAQYNAGEYAAALQSYRASYAEVRRPLRLLGMAQCYRRLDRKAEAVEHYKKYLEEWRRQNPDKEAPYLDEVRGHIAALSKQLDEERRRKEAAPNRPVQAPPSAAAPELPAPEDGGPNRHKTVIGYTALGIAGALVVTAGVLFGVGLSSRSSAHQAYLDATTQELMDQHWNDVESAQNKITAGHVLVGLGAVALGFSLYELLTRSPRADRRKVQLLPGRLGAALRASF